MSERIQIAIVDDHPLFRDGVVNTLRANPSFEVVGEGTTATDALRLASELLPDLLLLDLNIPGTGLKVIPEIADTSPVTKIVILTASEEEDDVVAALKAGARAYVLKGVAARELVRVLRSVCDGEAYVTPTLAVNLLADFRQRTKTQRPTSPLDDLTERERQILELVASGKSNKEIGAQLFLTEKTVKHHMTNILQKLHVRNRVEAALLAQKEGRSENS